MLAEQLKAKMTIASPKEAPALAQQSTLVPLPQLLDPNYIPDTLVRTYVSRETLKKKGQPTFPALEDWVEIFRHSIEGFRSTAEADPSLPELERQQGAAAFAEGYRKTIDELEQQAQEAAAASSSHTITELGRVATGRQRVLGCLELCRLREDALRAAGFRDIFEPIKRRENQQALAILPDVCAEIDAVSEPRQRWEMVLRGVFAGNIFDLGTAATTSMYHENGGVAFHATRDKLLPRPWVIDCLDQLIASLCSKAYKQAVLFVDNAGADVILGMLPFARELLRRGTAVVLAANELPAINDITAAELDALLPAIGAADDVLCKAISTQRLRVLGSGSGLPVIDLARVSAELAEAAAGADLIVLEGMGRSIETNLMSARFSCDAAWLGMVKHPEVAAALGGEMFDCVCQFLPGSQ